MGLIYCNRPPPRQTLRCPIYSPWVGLGKGKKAPPYSSLFICHRFDFCSYVISWKTVSDFGLTPTNCKCFIYRYFFAVMCRDVSRERKEGDFEGWHGGGLKFIHGTLYYGNWLELVGFTRTWIDFANVDSIWNSFLKNSIYSSSFLLAAELSSINSRKVFLRKGREKMLILITKCTRCDVRSPSFVNTVILLCEEFAVVK